MIASGAQALHGDGRSGLVAIFRAPGVPIGSAGSLISATGRILAGDRFRTPGWHTACCWGVV
jgi:hypothetical protein